MAPRRSVPGPSTPDCRCPRVKVNVDGLAKDLAFIKTLGLVKSNVAVTDIVGMAFAKAAVAELGPYKGRTG